MNFWEPIFGHMDKEAFPDYTGSICDQEEISKCHFKIEKLDNLSQHKAKKLLFKNVDFSGRKSIETEPYRFIFDDCEFIFCSFRRTTFDNVSFRHCRFEKTAFALCTFNDCEFRGCKFNDIGISGNTTVFKNTYIESYELLKSVYLNKNKAILEKNNTTRIRQRSKLEKTKMVVARKLTTMAPVRYDLENLTKSIEIARLQEIRFDIFDSIFKILESKKLWKKIIGFGKLTASVLSYVTVSIFGKMSGWGQELGKALIIGFFVVLGFSFIYSNIIFHDSLSFTQAMFRTFEYLLLFGYTKYSFADISSIGRVVIFINSVFGMLWFAVMFPIIINKMRPDDD